MQWQWRRQASFDASVITVSVNHTLMARRSAAALRPCYISNIMEIVASGSAWLIYHAADKLSRVSVFKRTQEQQLRVVIRSLTTNWHRHGTDLLWIYHVTAKKLHSFIFAIALSELHLLRQFLAKIYLNKFLIIHIFHIHYTHWTIKTWHFIFYYNFG